MLHAPLLHQSSLVLMDLKNVLTLELSLQLLFFLDRNNDVVF